MKRNIVNIAAVVIAAISFTSCKVKLKNPVEEWVNTTDSGRFSEVLYDDDDSITVFMDNETGVMYMWRGVGYRGGLTVMLDANGNPLLGNVEDEEESESNDIDKE